MNKFRFFLSALICMLSLSSSWAYTSEIDGVTWTWYPYANNSPTEAYISGVSNYSEHKDNLVVPETVSDGTTTYTVTSVGHPTSNYSSTSYHPFYNKTDITSVTLPNTLRTIGYYAFYGCSGLTSVVIPNSVTTYLSLDMAFLNMD